MLIGQRSLSGDTEEDAYEILSEACPSWSHRRFRASFCGTSEDNGSARSAVTKSVAPDHSSTANTAYAESIKSSGTKAASHVKKRYYVPATCAARSVLAERSSCASDSTFSQAVTVSIARVKPELPVASWTRGSSFVALCKTVRASCLEAEVGAPEVSESGIDVTKHLALP